MVSDDGCRKSGECYADTIESAVEAQAVVAPGHCPGPLDCPAPPLPSPYCPQPPLIRRAYLLYHRVPQHPPLFTIPPQSHCLGQCLPLSPSTYPYTLDLNTSRRTAVDMTTPFDIYAIPPGTCNSLDTYQRARLIRSTRKLGAVLGTTPRLAEAEQFFIPINPSGVAPAFPPSPATKASRRHGSVFTVFPTLKSPSSECSSVYSSSSSNSSLVSLSSLPEKKRPSLDELPQSKPFGSKGRSGDAPRPLVLRINAVTVPMTDTRVPLSPCTPSSPTHTDLPDEPSATEIRRKRMAKLARTFGENIPPELVFPQHAPIPRQTVSLDSGSQRPPLSARRSSQVWITGSASGAWTGEWNRKDIREVQQKLRNLKMR